MKLALIVAVAHNRVIGKGGKLPWHISEDLKRFKRLTTGHAVLMGRRTFESIGRPLPNRRNVVISSTAQPGVETYGAVPEALEALQNEERVFVIGGGQLYACLLDSADELYLTLVDKDVEGDTFFPPYEHLLGARFREVGREEHEGYTFVDYQRIL
ncbi:dihydrofolate reductase [bacterium]|nr:MAG: dihydrofolate reductase [bacterium]